MTTECFLQDYEDVLTPKEVQHILQISRNTLYKRLSEGSIRSVRIGKFYRIPKKSILWNTLTPIHTAKERAFTTKPDFGP